jgi:hypothetical protein
MNFPLLLTMSSFLYLLVLLVRKRFRSQVKVGTQIGALLGDVVLNRVVLEKTQVGVLVRSKDLGSTVEVPLDNVFMYDKYSPGEQSVVNISKYRRG